MMADNLAILAYAGCPGIGESLSSFYHYSHRRLARRNQACPCVARIRRFNQAQAARPSLKLVKFGIFDRFMRRRGTEEVVTGPTRNRITAQKAVRGFESHPLRHQSSRAVDNSEDAWKVSRSPIIAPHISEALAKDSAPGRSWIETSLQSKMSRIRLNSLSSTKNRAGFSPSALPDVSSVTAR